MLYLGGDKESIDVCFLESMLATTDTSLKGQNSPITGVINGPTLICYQLCMSGVAPSNQWCCPSNLISVVLP